MNRDINEIKAQLTPPEKEILDTMLHRHPELDACVAPLLEFHYSLVEMYDKKGTLVIAGNGGSHADAIHIVGELEKSFERKRPVPEDMAEKLKKQPFGDELSRYLEVGLPAVALGTATALKTATENDSPLKDIAFAQEAYAILRPQDIFLGISTSGNSKNVRMAMSVAKALGVKTVAMTGPAGGEMAKHAHIAIKAPGETTAFIQESHIVLYHAFCAMIEAHYFPEMR